jgi:excisionase family DNA binding protein
MDVITTRGAQRFLGVEAAAELLGVSSRSIYGWVSQRKICFRKAGRRLLFLESELIEWTKPTLHQHQPLQLTRR